MTIRRLVQSASITGVAIFMMAVSASASVILDTNAPGTVFVSSGTLVLGSAGGASATLTYLPLVNQSYGVPSNIQFGKFTVACASCLTQSAAGGAGGSVFGAFDFHLIITDQTDANATGMFTGHSAGGAIWSDVSQVNIIWSPTTLGPGTFNATGGTNFGPTSFFISNPTLIVAPNSGNPAGVTTVDGTVNSNLVPEPMTFVLIGTGLVGLGLLRRRTRKS